MSAEPRVLLLETSGTRGTVALAEGGTLLGVRHLDETRRHARDLAPSVQTLLAEQGWRPREVQLVIVSRGPGSYTGLRIGIMAAKAFAYATKCALVALGTFPVIAAQAPPGAGRIVVVADAQKDKVYAQSFERAADGTLSPVTELAIVPVAAVASVVGAGTCLAGPAVAKCAGVSAEGLFVEEAMREPLPETLLRLGLERFRAGECADLWTLEPLYLRPSSAEEQWQARRGGG